jgi:hypothetical protein
MKITVEGTPEECDTLLNVLRGVKKLDNKLEVEVVAIETVVEPAPRVPLVLINGGLGDRKQRVIELPKF